MTRKTPILTAKDVAAQFAARDATAPNPAAYAFYSSWFGGIVTEPELMMVPVDDHLVHRGDGVFETVKAVDKTMWLLDAHLTRLVASAASIGIELPWHTADIAAILRDTLEAGGHADALLRVLVSRGPGGFSVNPYEPAHPQLYVAAYPASVPFMTKNPGGARLKLSSVPVKPGLLARAKTCNYLPNALMKKEAVDAGVHYVVSVDEAGHIAESFTENVCMVDDGVLTRPPGERILAGTTMMRVFELADAAGIPTTVRPFTPEQLLDADEILIMGTTAEVTAVVEFEERAFEIGPMFERLAALLRSDLYGE